MNETKETTTLSNMIENDDTEFTETEQTADVIDINAVEPEELDIEDVQSESVTSNRKDHSAILLDKTVNLNADKTISEFEIEIEKAKKQKQDEKQANDIEDILSDNDDENDDDFIILDEVESSNDELSNMFNDDNDDINISDYELDKKDMTILSTEVDKKEISYIIGDDERIDVFLPQSAMILSFKKLSFHKLNVLTKNKKQMNLQDYLEFEAKTIYNLLVQDSIKMSFGLFKRSVSINDFALIILATSSISHSTMYGFTAKCDSCGSGNEHKFDIPTMSLIGYDDEAINFIDKLKNDFRNNKSAFIKNYSRLRTNKVMRVTDNLNVELKVNSIGDAIAYYSEIVKLYNEEERTEYANIIDIAANIKSIYVKSPRNVDGGYYKFDSTKEKIDILLNTSYELDIIEAMSMEYMYARSGILSIPLTDLSCPDCGKPINEHDYVLDISELAFMISTLAKEVPAFVKLMERMNTKRKIHRL